MEVDSRARSAQKAPYPQGTASFVLPTWGLAKSFLETQRYPDLRILQVIPCRGMTYCHTLPLLRACRGARLRALRFESAPEKVKVEGTCVMPRTVGIYRLTRRQGRGLDSLGVGIKPDALQHPVMMRSTKGKLHQARYDHHSDPAPRRSQRIPLGHNAPELPGGIGGR